MQIFDRSKLVIDGSGWERDRHGLVRRRGGLTNQPKAVKAAIPEISAGKQLAAFGTLFHGRNLHTLRLFYKREEKRRVDRRPF